MKKTLIKNAKKAGASHNDRAEAAEAIRNYDYHLKLHKLKEQEKREKEEDKAYKRNFFLNLQKKSQMEPLDRKQSLPHLQKAQQIHTTNKSMKHTQT